MGLKSGDLQTLLQSADAIASRGIKFDVACKVPCHADRVNTAVLQHLLEFGAPIEYRGSYGGYTTLEEARRKGHREIVELLLLRMGLILDMLLRRPLARVKWLLRGR